MGICLTQILNIACYAGFAPPIESAPCAVVLHWSKDVLQLLRRKIKIMSVAEHEERSLRELDILGRAARCGRDAPYCGPAFEAGAFGFEWL